MQTNAKSCAKTVLQVSPDEVFDEKRVFFCISLAQLLLKRALDSLALLNLQKNGKP